MMEVVETAARSLPPGSLVGRVGVVTGASSGIGAAIARDLATAGAALVVSGRDEGRLEATRAEIEELGAPWSRAVVAASEGADTARRLVELALECDGGIDVLVPCAGIFEPQSVFEGAVENLDRHIAINVRAPYELILAAAPHLRAGGSVILVSSICGVAGFAGAAAYCASKGAIEMLTRALARELAEREIRINAIAPGIIRTALNEAQLDGDPGYRESLVARTPLGRIGSAEEVAPAVTFLASDQARFITGASIPVDGGWLAE